MIEALKDKLNSVTEILIVANTPAYLFKHLRKELAPPAVRVTSEELFSELSRLLAEESSDQGFEELAYIYALIVLLSYDDDPQVLEKLKRLCGDSNLLWFTDLVHYYEQRSEITRKFLLIEGQDDRQLSGRIEVPKFYGLGESGGKHGSTSVRRF